MASKKRAAKRKLVHSTRPDLDALSVQDVRFCQFYAESGNASDAYRKAGYANSGSSDSAVGHAAWDKLRKAKIRDYVRELRQQSADVAGITVGRLARSLGRQAFSDRTAIYDKTGRVKSPTNWPDELRAIIAGFEVKEETETTFSVDANGDTVKVETVTVTYKVKFERSTEAKKLLAQWLGMVGSEVTLKDVVTNPLVVGGEAEVDKL